MSDNVSFSVAQPALPLFLYGSDTKSVDLLQYIFGRVNVNNNIFICTYADLAKHSGLSRQTVAKKMAAYCKQDLMRAMAPNMWMLNPATFYVGEESDLEQVKEKYESIIRPQ